jgi:hypothetical protein
VFVPPGKLDFDCRQFVDMVDTSEYNSLLCKEIHEKAWFKSSIAHVSILSFFLAFSYNNPMTDETAAFAKGEKERAGQRIIMPGYAIIGYRSLP